MTAGGILRDVENHFRPAGLESRIRLSSVGRVPEANDDVRVDGPQGAQVERFIENCLPRRKHQSSTVGVELAVDEVRVAFGVIQRVHCTDRAAEYIDIFAGTNYWMEKRDFKS